MSLNLLSPSLAPMLTHAGQCGEEIHEEEADLGHRDRCGAVRSCRIAGARTEFGIGASRCRAHEIQAQDAGERHSSGEGDELVPIPTKPPVYNGMIAPRDSWMMPPPCNEMIPPGAPRLLA